MPRGAAGSLEATRAVRVRREPLAGIARRGSRPRPRWVSSPPLVMPRGPATSIQGLLVIVSGLVVGVIAGAPVRALAGLASPRSLGYGVAFEVGRAGAVGPTVDGVRLDNAYGVLAFALGRGFHLLIASLALLFGASMGRRLAARLGRRARRGRRGRQASERWRARCRRPARPRRRRADGRDRAGRHRRRRSWAPTAGPSRAASPSSRPSASAASTRR